MKFFIKQQYYLAYLPLLGALIVSSCSPEAVDTPTSSESTQTNTLSATQTSVNTQSETSTNTQNQTQSNTTITTNTVIDTSSQTQTNTTLTTDTNIDTSSQTNTSTSTDTDTQTDQTNDADSDGVEDSKDACLQTAPNATVDAKGCSQIQLDSDLDGVNNDLDVCPLTLSNLAVNNQGCALNQLDSDQDGIFDDKDQCPNEPGQTDNNGCPLSTTPMKGKPNNITVSSSSDDGNYKAAQVIDGSLNEESRWSANGEAEWLLFDFNNVHTLYSIDMAFFKGNERQALFSVEVSIDSNNWTTILDTQSAGEHTELERFNMTAVNARYVRITAKGNTQSKWNSMTEIEFNFEGVTQQRKLLPGVLEAESYNRFYDTTPNNQYDELRRDDVDIAKVADNQWVVTDTTMGEWLEYDMTISDSNHYVFTSFAATTENNTQGALNIELAGQSKTIEVKQASYQHTSVNLGMLAAGEYTLRIQFEGNVNVDYYRISAGSVSLEQNPSHCAQPQIGDSGWVIDESRVDPRFSSEIREWVKAGVRGGIPCLADTNVITTLSPGDNIQSAIDSAPSNGGVILLKSGTWNINNTIKVKSNIILRGEDRANTRLNVHLRGHGKNRKFAIELEGAKHAGVENMTFFFSLPGWEPYDLEGYGESTLAGWKRPFENDKALKRGTKPTKDGSRFVAHGEGANVGFVLFDNGTQDSWVQNTNMLESGSNPIQVMGRASHITIRNNVINRCYQKGGGGNCYVDIKGDHNLIYNNEVYKLRHYAVQNGAKYNVTYDNYLEVDVNYHNGDEGYNLVEKNEIKLPFNHSWRPYSTGGPTYGHDAPGVMNLIWNNDADHKGREFTGDDITKMYHFKGYGQVYEYGGAAPSGGTLYPLKRQ